MSFEPHKFLPTFCLGWQRLLSDINATTYSTITYLEFFSLFHKTARRRGFKIKATEGGSFSGAGGSQQRECLQGLL